MRCSSCGHANRESATFCEACGARLTPVCPRCAAELRPGARFCDSCGQRLAAPARQAPTPDPRTYTPRHLAEKILEGRAALEGERRTVTVLFVDAVGSTPMAERLDEEAFYTIMQGCFARMIDAVHGYEGTIAQFLGDGFLAIFGAPIAHEDSARRAVAAALLMQRSLAVYTAEVHQRHQVECRFRVGLNTGPVIVGKIGDDLTMDYTAIGDTANLAARMQQLAEPGSVYLSEQTYQAVRDYVECEPLGAFAVKGKAAPVAIYRALREKPGRTRLAVAAERGITPFVGRAHELGMLRSYFERACRGQGQVVFVSGEAGIGKSRLLMEFQRAIADQDITWLEGHCISYGKSIPYLPINEIIKRDCGVQEGDGEAAIIRRVDERTAGWEEAARRTVPYLKYLLDVDPGAPDVVAMDPLVRRAGIFDGLRALLLQESRQRPLVVVVEDLHWADENSEEALAAVMDVIAAVKVLLVVTYRPGYAPSLGERTYYTRLHLDDLEPEDSAALAAAALQATALPQQLQDLITKKAEGNPFYIEEVTRALVAAGAIRQSNGTYTLAHPIEQIRIPNTIQEIILSRIDRLERPAREVIQRAAVIGRAFPLWLLQRIVDLKAELEELLGELKAQELIYQSSYFPELAFMFKHALTHEVAYSTLLFERRKALHHIVGAAIEELYAERLPEHYETLAFHYSRSDDSAKAIDYLVKAGQKAVDRHANPQALRYFEQALELAKSGAQYESILARRARLLLVMFQGKAAVSDYERLLESARRNGNQPQELEALLGLGRSYYVLALDEPEADWAARSRDLYVAAYTLARRLDDKRGMVRALVRTGWFYDFWPEYRDQAVADLREALAISQESGDEELIIHSRLALFGPVMKGILSRVELEEQREELVRALEARHDLLRLNELNYQLMWLDLAWGNFERALACCDAGIKLAEQIGALPVQYSTLKALALLKLGRYGEAWEALQQEVADDEHPFGRAMRSLGEGTYLFELMAYAQASEVLRDVIAQATRLQRPWMRIWAETLLAQSLLRVGQLDTGNLAQLSQDLAPVGAEVILDPSLVVTEILLMEGRLDEALRQAEASAAEAQQHGRTPDYLAGLELRSHILLRLGRPADARAIADEALRIAEELHALSMVWRVQAARAPALAALNDAEAASQAYAVAAGIIWKLANTIADPALRQGFLSSAEVAGVLAAATS